MYATDFKYPEDGIYILDGFLKPEMIERFRQAYFKSYEYCRAKQIQHGIAAKTENTVHHTFFMDPVFAELLEMDEYLDPIKAFFDNKKFILNSLGGNNNIRVQNYASNIHRDVRFFTEEPMFLNTIICVTGYTDDNGPTEFMPGSHRSEEKVSEEEFEANRVSFTCKPGSIIYFDSRLWHRAGKPTGPMDERIIFTPIFSRPFIKQGYNYARQMQMLGADRYSENLKQVMGYYSDTPCTHDQWYNINERRFYYAEQDQERYQPDPQQ